MTVKAKSPSPVVKYTTLKKKNVAIAAKNAVTVSEAKGTVTYSKVSGPKKISVAKSGKITVTKGLAKGTYKVKIKVIAAGGTNYKKGSKTITIKVIVK